MFVVGNRSSAELGFGRADSVSCGSLACPRPVVHCFYEEGSTVLINVTPPNTQVSLSQKHYFRSSVTLCRKLFCNILLRCAPVYRDMAMRIISLFINS